MQRRRILQLVVLMRSTPQKHPFTPNGGHGLDMPPRPPGSGTREHAPRRRTPLGGGSTSRTSTSPPSRNSSRPPSPPTPPSDGANSDEGPTTPTQLNEFERERRIDYREPGVARRLSLGLRSGEVTPWLRAKLETLRLDLHPHASAMEHMGVGPTGSIPESPRENLRSFWLLLATALVTGAASCYALRRASASGALHLRAATFRAAGGSAHLGARGMLLFRVAALCVGLNGVRPNSPWDSRTPGTVRACARAGSFSAFAWAMLCASSAAGGACSWLALWGGTQSFTTLQHLVPSMVSPWLSVFSLPVSAWLLFEASLAATLLVALLATCVFVPSELACW